jgi:hypothetical protein
MVEMLKLHKHLLTNVVALQVELPEIKPVMKLMSAIFIPIVTVGVAFFVGVEEVPLEPLDPLVIRLLN